MKETNRLFLGRLWYIRGYKPGRGYITNSVENKFRIFYLTKSFFGGAYEKNAFKDIETGLCYPLDVDVISENFFVNTKEIVTLRDAFPTINFPAKLSERQLLEISNFFNQMQCEIYNEEETKKQEIEEKIACDIKTKVLKPGRYTVIDSIKNYFNV